MNKESASIVEIVGGCISNNRRAQKLFYKMFYDFAFGICSRYASNKDDADSIVNEGFFKVFNQLHFYNHEKSILPWIRKIMVNTSIDFYRSNLKFDQNRDIELYENSFSADEQIYSKLVYEDLLSIIQRLSPNYRTVFNLYAIEGLNHTEIAEELNISVGTSKSNLFRARAKLMEMVKSLDVKPNVNVY